MNIRQFIPPVALTLFQKLTRKKLTSYKVGRYEIKIPDNFSLPRYQGLYPLYDTFLPVLAKQFGSKGTLVDVGANIGATSVSVLQNCQNPVICFEPSEYFSPYLEHNLALLPSANGKRFSIIKQLVGTGVIAGELNHIGGRTASITVTEKPAAATHTPLDSIVPNTSDILFIKVDTDGFDFDVLKSASKIMTDSEPLLYWENEIKHEFQLKGYSELYDMLAAKGYKYVYIFDNYGNLISEESDFQTLKNINDYTWSMEKYNCTRTLYYTDVLASTEKYSGLAKEAIREFKKGFIFKK